MNTKLIIKTALETALPDEVFIIGPTATNNIIEGYTRISVSRKGSNLDTSTAVNLVISAIGFITAIIQLYVTLKESKGTTPTEGELRVEININNIDASGLTNSQINSLVSIVTLELTSQENSNTPR